MKNSKAKIQIKNDITAIILPGILNFSGAFFDESIAKSVDKNDAVKSNMITETEPIVRYIAKTTTPIKAVGSAAVPVSGRNAEIINAITDNAPDTTRRITEKIKKTVGIISFLLSINHPFTFLDFCVFRRSIKRRQRFKIIRSVVYQPCGLFISGQLYQRRGAEKDRERTRRRFEHRVAVEYGLCLEV